MHQFLHQVLKLYGVDSLTINGTLSFEKRNEVVEEFYKPGKARVFIFSSVGCTGLNLSIARSILLLVSNTDTGSP